MLWRVWSNPRCVPATMVTFLCFRTPLTCLPALLTIINGSAEPTAASPPPPELRLLLEPLAHDVLSSSVFDFAADRP